MHYQIHQLILWYQANVDSGGYLAIAMMMALESTFLPIPSEFVIPYVAKHPGEMNLPGIILAGTLGSLVGASFMYWVSRWIGGAVLGRYGWYFLLPEPRLCLAEQATVQFGPYVVFVTRLLPVMRHLIGVPMGMLRMNFILYIIATGLGAAIWCAMLALYGTNYANDPETLQKGLHNVTVGLFGGLTILVLLYYFLIHPFIWDDPRKRRLRQNEAKMRLANPPVPTIISMVGRVGREVFWFTWLFILVMSLIARVVLGAVVADHELHWVRLAAYIVIAAVWLWIAVAVQAKRWHDLGKSGWMVCLNLIPGLGTLYSLAILGFRAGTSGANEYGEEQAVAARY